MKVMLVLSIMLLITSIYASQTVNLEKEKKEAKNDLIAAKKSYNNGDYKWATIQAYFSIYHSTQVILNREWVLDTESAHKELSYMLKKEEEIGEVPNGTSYKFDIARWARINANYRGYYKKDTALETIKSAEEFLRLIK